MLPIFTSPAGMKMLYRSSAFITSTAREIAGLHFVAIQKRENGAQLAAVHDRRVGPWG